MVLRVLISAYGHKRVKCFIYIVISVSYNLNICIFKFIARFLAQLMVHYLNIGEIQNINYLHGSYSILTL